MADLQLQLTGSAAQESSLQSELHAAEAKLSASEAELASTCSQVQAHQTCCCVRNILMPCVCVSVQDSTRVEHCWSAPHAWIIGCTMLPVEYLLRHSTCQHTANLCCKGVDVCFAEQRSIADWCGMIGFDSTN